MVGESINIKIKKMKKELFSAVSVAALFLAPILNSQAAITDTTTYGTIPGLPAGSNPYSGSGIPYNNSEITTISGLPASDTLTLAMSATQHGSSNPAPGNNGAGTFTVSTGLVAGRSPWNFDFYINSANGSLTPYTFTLTEAANGQTFTFNPLLIPDNVGGPSSAGNSESLDFAQFGVPINYNPNQNDTYNFTLEASMGGTEIGSDSITVISGTGAVPEPSTIAAGAMMLLPLSFGALRMLRNRKTQPESPTAVG